MSVRVALVYRRFALGGSLPRHALFLATGLAAERVEVHCFCDARMSDLGEAAVTVHDVRPLLRGTGRLVAPLERSSFATAATRALRRRRGEFDLVHVIGPDAWGGDVIDVHEVVAAAQRRWPREAGRDYRFAGLRAAGAPFLRPRTAVERAVQRRQLRAGRYRRVIAVSDGVRDDVISTFGVPRELVDVVPYAVDVEAFAAATKGELRRRLGVTETDHVLLFVGHDFERKGLGDAIASLAGLPPATHLVVVGGGRAAPFAAQAAELGMAERVHFLGAAADLRDLYADADLLVLPSRHDAWGIPLVEAMAAGIPSVTTHAAGAATVVEAAHAGVVVRVGDPAELAAAIGGLVGNPDRRVEMGARGRRAAVRFGRERHIESVLEVYERALAEARRDVDALVNAVGGASP